jgi:hypothetical protein
VGHDLLDVRVVENGVTASVEQVVSNSSVTLGGKAPADVLDVVVDAEGLLDHDHRPRRGLLRLDVGKGHPPSAVSSVTVVAIAAPRPGPVAAPKILSGIYIVYLWTRVH